MSPVGEAQGAAVRKVRQLFRRGPWEALATAFIGIGVVMLCQPFLLELYTYSFVTILAGTVLFAIVSKFPD
jgi:hypothetical protein